MPSPHEQPLLDGLSGERTLSYVNMENGEVVLEGSENRAPPRVGALVYIAFAVAAIGGLLFGYVIGVTGNIVTDQTAAGNGGLVCLGTGTCGNTSETNSSSYTRHTCWDLSSGDQEVLTATNIITALVGTILMFRFGDDIGRKRELIASGILYCTGATVSAAAQAVWMVYVGQAIYGFGVGLAMHAAPIFIAETSPAHRRGLLVSMKEAVIVVGILLGFSIGAAFQNTADGWRYMYGTASLLAIPLIGLMPFIPRSPRWVVLRAMKETGRLDEKDRQDAVECLKKFRTYHTDAQIAAEVESIVETLGAELLKAGEEAPNKYLAAFKERRALVIGCGLVMLQQITGQPSVLYYATSIFKSAGFGSSASIQPVFIGIAKLLFTLIAVFNVDKYGRRKLLFIGIALMTVALAMLAVAFAFLECKAQLPDGTTPSAAECYLTCDCPEKGCTDNVGLPGAWGPLSIVALILYVAGYQAGFGPIAWLIISEVFPLKTRSAAFSIAAVTNFTFNIVITITFKSVLEAIGQIATFSVYGGLCVISLLFVYFIVPETKGLTLEQIDEKLKRR